MKARTQNKSSRLDRSIVSPDGRFIPLTSSSSAACDHPDLLLNVIMLIAGYFYNRQANQPFPDSTRRGDVEAGRQQINSSSTSFYAF